MELSRVVQRLRERGLKVTPQRLELLKALMAARQPLTARELARAVRATHPHVSLDTVYRNLGVLVECGLVNQINLQNRESARFEFQDEGTHHHHLVCLGCGKAFCVDWCPARSASVRPPADPGFRVVGHAFELYGYCSACQAP